MKIFLKIFLKERKYGIVASVCLVKQGAPETIPLE
jgi:hypothetical protein